MEPNGTNENRVPAVPCRSGCGFYGSIACEGFCSKCYTDLVKSRHDNARAEKMGESSSSMESASSGRVQSAGEIKHQQDRSEGADICEALRRASVSEKESAAAAESAESLVHSSADLATDNTTSAVTAAVQLEPAPSDTVAAAPDKSAGGSVAEDADISSESKSKKKNRCNTCNKRVGLTGFPCRCGGLYCSMHRYSDTHACTFNYKELAQEDIRKNNPVVVAEKIKKI